MARGGPSALPRYDLHVHTVYSGHSTPDASVANMVFSAAEAGVDVLAVTEHVPTVVPDVHVELNIDGASFFHSNQATIGNTATFVGAYTNGLWNSFLYAHADNSNLNGDRLWINGKEASGGGTGTDVLDIQPGSDTLAIGEANKSSVFNINGAVGDLMIFDQELGEPEARIVDNPADINYADLILDDTNIASVYDFGGIR